MNHILETILFIVLFGLIGYLFLLILGGYASVQTLIAESELKMDDKINNVKKELRDLIKEAQIKN